MNKGESTTRVKNILIQENDRKIIVNEEDTCVICGAYIPEGFGMVCYDCQSKYMERYPNGI